MQNNVLHQTQAIKKAKKGNLGNFIMKYNFIHDALKVITNQNLKRQRNFEDIGSFGDMGTSRSSVVRERKMTYNRHLTNICQNSEKFSLIF